jgi:hypothetical protein
LFKPAAGEAGTDEISGPGRSEQREDGVEAASAATDGWSEAWVAETRSSCCGREFVLVDEAAE